MATTTPRRSFGRPRPSLGNSSINTASSPSLNSSFTSQRHPLPSPQISTLHIGAPVGRKPSLNKTKPASATTLPDGRVNYGLTPTQEEVSSPFAINPITPTMNSKVNGDWTGDGILEEGDLVDVPGGMHGTVKFIGEVKGKKGMFAGVELSREWAPRGKNDGDVEGTRYFATSIPGAGIFLPLNKAFKRASPTQSTDSFPATPASPSLGAFNIGGRADSNAYMSPLPSVAKFSQSIGLGRAASPAFRPKSRPSLPRPESPLRKSQNPISTPVGRTSLGAAKLPKTIAAPSRYAPSPTPGKFSTSVRTRKESTSGDPGKRLGYTPKPGTKTFASARPASRSQSRLGPDPMFDRDLDTTPIGVARTSYSRQGMSDASRPFNGRDDEVRRLKNQLEGRDKQLEEQASSLAEMENNVAELQALLPNHGSESAARGNRSSDPGDTNAAQLRTLLREKNDKISMLTAEFDAHRADFRSTIDTLELASTETERVYERRVEELSQELRELQDRDEDVESVARQLKQLEELVQELEEGLEDARRGEAEARGEVEFLRGEVERGRSELRREREKAAAALKGAGAAVDSGMNSSRSSREVEQRDDEIRGLKAIIHSLSRESVPDVENPNLNGLRSSKSGNGSISQANGHNADQLAEERQARELLEREVKELEGLVDRKTYREDELEQELEQLRNENAANKHASAGSNRTSGQTVVPSNRGPGGNPQGAPAKWHEHSSSKDYRHRELETMHEGDTHSTMTDGSNLWCEICETSGHDILTCTNMFGSQARNGDEQEQKKDSPNSQRTGRDVVVEGLKGLSASSPQAASRFPQSSQAMQSPGLTPRAQQASMPNPMDQGMVAGKASGIIDETKWCALCERDGHESVDCPFEEAF